MKRIKYPATLDVTVKGITPTSGQEISMKSRPMHALEGDVLLNYAASLSGQDLEANYRTFDNASKGVVEEESIAYLLGHNRILPGQV